MPASRQARSPEFLAAARYMARYPHGRCRPVGVGSGAGCADRAGAADFIRAQAWRIGQRRAAAMGYGRDLGRLEDHVMGAPCPAALRRDLIARPDDPAVGWRLIRELCRARRYLKASVAAHYNLGCLARDARLEAALAGEIALWLVQRAAIRRQASRRAA